MTGLTTKNFSKLDHSSLEDLIPKYVYLNAVKSAYTLSEVTLNETDSTDKMITHQVDEYLKTKELGKIDKLKITEQLLPLLDGISKEICDTFVPIFLKINEIKKFFLNLVCYFYENYILKKEHVANCDFKL